jgi:hypothetical protein
MSLNKSRVTDRTVPVKFTLILRNDHTGEVETEEVCPKVRSLSYERWQQLFPPDRNGASQDKETLARQLSEVVADLDIVDDDKNPFPPTIENLKTIDMPILTQYSEAILRFFVPATSSSTESAPSTSDS